MLRHPELKKPLSWNFHLERTNILRDLNELEIYGFRAEGKLDVIQTAVTSANVLSDPTSIHNSVSDMAVAWYDKYVKCGMQ